MVIRLPKLLQRFGEPKIVEATILRRVKAPAG
jgi:hypothetical protein